MVGVFADGKLGGMAGFVRESGEKERHKGTVVGVYLNQSLRGKGVGRAMLQALLDRAAGIEGLEQIVLKVATTQAAALATYRSLGFTSFGNEVRALYVDGQYIDEEYMVLSTALESRSLVGLTAQPSTECTATDPGPSRCRSARCARNRHRPRRACPSCQALRS